MIDTKERGHWCQCPECRAHWDRAEFEACPECGPGCECDEEEGPPVMSRLEQCNALIRKTAQRIGEFLVLKNTSYQNAIFEPARIFGKTSALENVNSRIDEKLNRIILNGKYPGDDDAIDLLGYLLLREAIKETEKGGRKATQGGGKEASAGKD